MIFLDEKDSKLDEQHQIERTFQMPYCTNESFHPNYETFWSNSKSFLSNQKNDDNQVERVGRILFSFLLLPSGPNEKQNCQVQLRMIQNLKRKALC